MPLTEKELDRLVAKYGPLMSLGKRPKPRPVLAAEVSEKFAEAAKRNPSSVRLSARAEDETTVVERPRRSDIVEVLAVDNEGRPKLARNYDATTNTYGMVEFEGGYRQSRIESVYDPIERGLKIDG